MEVARLASEMKRLSEAVSTFAALAAGIRRHLENQPGHPETDAALLAVADATLPGSIKDVGREELADILAGAILQMAEAHDLLRSPARTPGWSYADADVLIAQGRSAASHAHTWTKLAETRPSLASALTGRFLDVGTGVAGLALEAAALNPSLRVVGIDIHEPALAIAREAVRASPHAERIEIRNQDVTVLGEESTYTFAWVPTGFLSRSVALEALRRVFSALTPGGFVLVGTRGGSTGELQSALAALRVLRSGGYLWPAAELKDYLSSLGFVDIEAFPGPGRIDLLARKPTAG